MSKPHICYHCEHWGVGNHPLQNKALCFGENPDNPLFCVPEKTLWCHTCDRWEEKKEPRRCPDCYKLRRRHGDDRKCFGCRLIEALEANYERSKEKNEKSTE